MKKEPLVSILMNCFNGEIYLKKAISSILNQTYKNWELIFWDNSTNKNCYKIVKKIKDKRIKYFYHKKKLPLYASRNLALTKCKGTLIAFLDQDDYWDKDKLIKQVPLFKDKKVGLVYSNFFKYNEKKIIKIKLSSTRKLPAGFVTNKLLKNYDVGLLTIVIRKKFLRKISTTFDPKYNMLADMKFVLNFSRKYKFNCVQKPLATYRYHTNQMSNKYFNLSVTQHLKWLNSEAETKYLKKFREFNQLVQKIKFMEIINLINQSKNIYVLKKIINFPNKLYKTKLLLKFFLPSNCFRYLFGNLY